MRTLFPRVIPILGLLALTLSVAMTGSPAVAGDWVTFTDETDTRLVADPSVGVDDTQEKDFAIGDVDRDGDIDLIVARKLPFTNLGPRRNVLLMNESGVLTDRTATLAPDMLDLTDDRDIVLVDLDGDEWLDVVTATTLGDQPRIYKNLGDDSQGVWLGFDYEAARLPSFNPAPQFCAVAAGDLTGQNGPDLIFADYDNDLENRLLVNDGNGFFTDETSTRMTAAMAETTFGTDLEIADMNGDTFLDIVKNNSSGNFPPPDALEPQTSILYNDGTGTFTVEDVVYSEAPYMTHADDFNQDGLVDIFIVDDGQDRVLTNLGNDGQNQATFDTRSIAGSPDTAFLGGNTFAADVDLDGVLDIAVADVDTDIPNCDDGELTILRGTGTPPNITYTDPLGGASRPWRQDGVFDIAIFDINGDGSPDLYIGHCNGTKIFMGDPDLAARLFADGFESGDLGGWGMTGP
ncbi:MAG: VCBS repeat-containing protein [Acidobacteriota bacterium]